MTETRCEFSHVFGSSVRELEWTVVVVGSVIVGEMRDWDLRREARGKAGSRYDRDEMESPIQGLSISYQQGGSGVWLVDYLAR